jgi:hypothetical protein
VRTIAVDVDEFLIIGRKDEDRVGADRLACCQAVDPQGCCVPVDAVGIRGGDGKENRFEGKIGEMDEYLSIA